MGNKSKWDWGSAFWFTGGWIAAMVSIALRGEPPDLWVAIPAALIAFPVLAWMFRE